MYLVDMNIMTCNICFYDMRHYNKVFEPCIENTNQVTSFYRTVIRVQRDKGLVYILDIHLLDNFSLEAFLTVEWGESDVDPQEYKEVIGTS